MNSDYGRMSVLGALGMALALAAPAGAQQPTTDGGFYAWVGCWQPEAAEGAVAPDGAAPTVCVTPSGAGVEISTVVDGKVVETDRLQAGERVPSDRESCTGFTTATWSADGQRLFRRAEFTCPGGAQRQVDGIFAVAPDGAWLDVQALGNAGESAVRVVRHRPVTELSNVPSTIRTALQGHAMATSTARLAASAAVDLDDVVEASRALDGQVVGAWLLERGQGFGLELDGDRLVHLQRSGVPAPVIDMVVALTYPARFAINRASGETETREREAAARPRPRDGYYPGYGYGGIYDGYGSYYGGYGYGGRYGYGSRYGWYGRPVIIVRNPENGNGEGDGATAGRGRAVNGRGYTRSGSGTSSPAPRPSADRGSSSGGSASGSSGDSGSSGSSGSSGRTAKPRP